MTTRQQYIAIHPEDAELQEKFEDWKKLRQRAFGVISRYKNSGVITDQERRLLSEAIHQANLEELQSFNILDLRVKAETPASIASKITAKPTSLPYVSFFHKEAPASNKESIEFTKLIKNLRSKVSHSYKREKIDLAQKQKYLESLRKCKTLEDLKNHPLYVPTSPSRASSPPSSPEGTPEKQETPEDKPYIFPPPEATPIPGLPMIPAQDPNYHPEWVAGHPGPCVKIEPPLEWERLVKLQALCKEHNIEIPITIAAAILKL